jgi:CRP-like cAMP-binding protein
MQKGEIVYREGDTAEEFYVIKVGEFEVHRTQMIDARDAIDKYQDDANDIMRPRSRAATGGKILKRVCLCLLDKGQVFGAGEAF